MLTNTERFLTQKVDDLTYMFFERSCVGTVYVLMATSFASNSHVSLALAEDSGQHTYVSFSKEIWSSTLYEANLINLVSYLASYILEDTSLDIANPIPFVLQFGGNLHGSDVKLPSVSISSLH